VFVDCHNQQRFFVSEADLKSGNIQSEDDKERAVSDMYFRRMCSEQVRKMVRFPSSYNEGAHSSDRGRSFHAMVGAYST
jgi:hypothetical protein